MAAKRTRREMPPPSSSKEEDLQTKRIERCPVLLGKNIDLVSFTFDVHSFHIEAAFRRSKRVKITQDLICSILRLEDGGIRLYTTKTIPYIEEYNLVEACRRVTGETLRNTCTPKHKSTYTYVLCILHNIIAHIIVPRKGHLMKVNHYDDFLLDSILLGRKLDFPYIMLQHMNSVLSGTKPKALPYGMILTKVFEHFRVSVHYSITSSSQSHRYHQYLHSKAA
ncbi:Uncharacterized protein Adt_38828 [Abeliophyllum distichum]|uniref:Putative plant transposon protein domain-containing protein n=1 Tax=Abeliophyllum distichum TaxID=126358 RepID=A0ABD1Q4E4_9LAMI